MIQALPRTLLAIALCAGLIVFYAVLALPVEKVKTKGPDRTLADGTHSASPLPMTAQARRLIDETVTEARRRWGADDPAGAIEKAEVAIMLLRDRGRNREAARLLVETGVWYVKTGETERGTRYLLSAYVQALDGEGDSWKEIAREALSKHRDLVFALSGEKKEREALRLLEIFLEVFRERGLRQLEADSLHNTAWVLADNGRPRKAVEVYGEALSGYRALKRRDGEGWTLNNMGDALLQAGELDRAASRLFEALEIARRAFPGIRRKVVDNLTLLMEEAGERGRLELVRSVSARLLPFVEASGAWHLFDRVLFTQVKAFRRNGCLAEAHEALARLEARSREERYLYGVALYILEDGKTWARQGEIEKALDRFREALQVQERIGDRLGASWTRETAGRALADAGRHEEAVRRLEEALAGFEEAGAHREGVLSVLPALASSLEALGRQAEAEEVRRRFRVLEAAPLPGDLEKTVFFEQLDRRAAGVRAMGPDDILVRVRRVETGWRFLDVPTGLDLPVPFGWRGRHVVFQGMHFRLEGSHLSHQGFRIFMSHGDEAAVTLRGTMLRAR